MKKLLAVILAVVLLGTCCFAEEDELQFGRMNDPSLLPYMQDTIYQAVLENLDSNEYFVENVSAIYISDEYLEELAFNSQSNIYFGYTLDDLESQFQGKRYIFTLSETNETTVREWEAYDDVMEKVIRERFHGRYPVRKSIQTEFAHVGGESGLQFQVDAVAYCGPGSSGC